MLSGYRFRAYPTAHQAARLRVWIGHQRFIYNAKVGEQEYWHRFSRASLSLAGQRPFPDQAYSQFKDDELTPWLSDVPSQILRNGAYRYASGSARFLKGLSSAPKIKKKHGRQSVLITSELFEFVERVHGPTGEVGQELRIGTARFPFGVLKFKAHRAWTCPKMLVVSIEPSGQWHVSFCSERPALAGGDARALSQTRMAKSVLDAGWSTYRTMLQYKCANAGVWFKQVNERYSTQECSACHASRTGPKGLEGLGVRTWTCTACHAVHDRDTNSALIVEQRGLEWLREEFSAALEEAHREPAGAVNEEGAQALTAAGHGRPIEGIPVLFA